MTRQIKRQCLEVCEGAFRTHENATASTCQSVIDKRPAASTAGRDPRTIDAQNRRSAPARHRPRVAAVADETSGAACVTARARHRPSNCALSHAILASHHARPASPPPRSARNPHSARQQCHSIISNTIADPIVRWPAERLVTDRAAPSVPNPLQKTADLARAQIKHMRR